MKKRKQAKDKPDKPPGKPDKPPGKPDEPPPAISGGMLDFSNADSSGLLTVLGD